MKRLLSIGLLLLLLLVACAPKGDDGHVTTRHGTSLPTTSSPELAAVDSLLWLQPDSALAVLLDYFACRDALYASPDIVDSLQRCNHCVSTSYDDHYAHLLLAELLYKNYYEQTNRAELLEAVAYYDSLMADTRGVSLQWPRRKDARRASAQTTAFLAARAHYINGVGYSELDSVVPACKEYLKALEVMEQHFEEKELVGNKARFMALTYTHLTDLFSNLYLPEQTISFGKEALEYYRIYHATPWHVAWVLDEIGSNYEMMNEYDSAIFYYQAGLESLSDDKNLSYRDLTTRLAYCSYVLTKDWVTSLNQLYELMNQADSEKELLSRSLTIAEIFYHEALYDSAWLYLRKVYEGTKSTDSKKQAAEWLVEICKAKNRDEEAHEYADFLVPFANLGENQSGIKSQLITLYYDFKQVRLEYQQHKEEQKRIRLGVAILSALFFLIFFLFYRNIKREKDLETERHAHKIQQAALAGRLKRSNANLKEQEKKQASTSTLSSLQCQNNAEKYIDEPICKHVLAICNDKSNPIKSTVPVSAYSSMALNDIQKARLKDAAMQHYGQLFEMLKRQHPELKEKDFFYCYLCLLGLDNVQIAVLQQNSISTIWERENRLKRIFGSEDKVSIILHGFMNY